ncbi:MAG: hypothetical protein JWM64_235 [Frankiales bacterium]|nr:hypothetical protein [Frankiales bacterium]
MSSPDALGLLKAPHAQQDRHVADADDQALAELLLDLAEWFELLDAEPLTSGLLAQMEPVVDLTNRVRAEQARRA